MAITRSQMGSQLRGDRMPAKSKKQQRFMAAVANNPEFAEEVGVPKKVGEKFMKMKKGYKAGGKLKMVKGPDGKMVPDYAADGKGKMNKGGKVKKYQMGGMASMMRYLLCSFYLTGIEHQEYVRTVSFEKCFKTISQRRQPFLWLVDTSNQDVTGRM